MEYAPLSYATFVVLLLVLVAFYGKRAEELIAHANSKEFPGLDFYWIGFAWQDILPMLSYEGKFAEQMKSDIVVYYGERYAEYYCRLILAQIYTYVHLIVCGVSIFACFSEGTAAMLIDLIGTIVAFAVGYSMLNSVSEKLKERALDCVEEFPNMVTKLALMISSGMILREAWMAAAKSTTGQLNTLMMDSCENMMNGYSDVEAINEFGIKSGSKEIKKFSAELIQGIGNGSSELVGVLTQQSSELWEHKRQLALQRGEKAATKLVLPTTMMFAGLIMVVVVAAMAGMSV